MFIKHPTEERFDPLIARYLPNNENNYFDFNEIYYNSINEFWEGRIDIFTYDEHHLISFEFLPDGEKRTITYGTPSQSNLRTLSDCREVSREVSWVTPSPENTADDPLGLGATYHSITIKETLCTGSMGEFPTTGTVYVDGTYYYNGSGFDPSGAGCGTCYTPPSAPAPSLFIINRITNTCAKKVFLNLAKGAPKLGDMTGISNLDIFPWMLELFKQGGKFNYKIQNSYFNSEKAAFTTPPSIGDDTIRIVLNDKFLMNATSLSIARTIIHETAHAYLIYVSKLRPPLIDPGFLLQLNNYHNLHNTNVIDTHHAMMNQFLLGFAVSLYNWDKNYGETGEI